MSFPWAVGIVRQGRHHGGRMSPWRRAHNSASRLAEGRNAIRLANLALAATARNESSLGGRQLRAATERLAVSGQLECDGDFRGWQALADESRTAVAELGGVAGHDIWVRASQEADPARKTRGAYATPRGLADPMASLLLRRCDELPARILDPSAGGGGLLLATFRHFARAEGPSRAVRRLHGVELDPVARELCCLQIWLACRGVEKIDAIAGRIHCDNAITRAWDADELYDALIMNPPWESLRHPGTSELGERRQTIDRLRRSLGAFGSGLPPLFSCQGRGDRNLYKAFLELAVHLVGEGGSIVALIPGAWSSDLGTRPLRDLYLSHTAVEQWTSFENREGYFPIDGRYKFGVLQARRSSRGTNSFSALGMASKAGQLNGPHVRISKSMLARIGGSSRLIPDLVSPREARLLGKFAAAGSGFFAESPALGAVRYERELDLTEDRRRGRFQHVNSACRTGPASWVGGDGQQLRPLVEGRMVGQYDFFEKSWIEGAGRTARWSYNNGHRLRDCEPQFLAPRLTSPQPRLAICDITSATNTRTVRASWLPPRWPCGNTAPILIFEDELRALAALAVLNSMVFDWQARRIVAGLHLNRFYLEAMRMPSLGADEVEVLARRARENPQPQPAVPRDRSAPCDSPR